MQQCLDKLDLCVQPLKKREHTLKRCKQNIKARLHKKPPSIPTGLLN